jgi:hypothetical protein
MMEEKMDTAMSVAQKAMKAYRKKVGSLSNTEAAVNSIRFELEKTIKYRMEDILASVDQGALGLQEEVNATPEETKPSSHGVNAVLPYANEEPPPRKDSGHKRRPPHEELHFKTETTRTEI